MWFSSRGTIWERQQAESRPEPFCNVEVAEVVERYICVDHWWKRTSYRDRDLRAQDDSPRPRAAYLCDNRRHLSDSLANSERTDVDA